jgi:hypothetical protein
MCKEADKTILGVHIYPWTKVAIHRTLEKCVSVAWHPRSQAIYILPEGDSTFTNPPFFFPWDRYGGCTTVGVSLAKGLKPWQIKLQFLSISGAYTEEVDFSQVKP